MYNQLSKARVLVGALIFRSANFNSPVLGVKTGTTSLNPASIAATTRGSVTFTVTGAAVGDAVVMQPPATLEDDLVYCGAAVTAADTVTVYLYNPTAGAIDGAAATWTYTVIDLT